MLLSSVTALVVPQHQLGEELLTEDTACFVLLQKRMYTSRELSCLALVVVAFHFLNKKMGVGWETLISKSLRELWLHRAYCATFIKCAVLQCRRRCVESHCFHLCCYSLASSAEF